MNKFLSLFFVIAAGCASAPTEVRQDLAMRPLTKEEQENALRCRCACEQRVVVLGERRWLLVTGCGMEPQLSPWPEPGQEW